MRSDGHFKEMSDDRWGMASAAVLAVFAVAMPVVFFSIHQPTPQVEQAEAEALVLAHPCTTIRQDLGWGNVDRPEKCVNADLRRDKK